MSVIRDAIEMVEMSENQCYDGEIDEFVGKIGFPGHVCRSEWWEW